MNFLGTLLDTSETTSDLVTGDAITGWTTPALSMVCTNFKLKSKNLGALLIMGIFFILGTFYFGYFFDFVYFFDFGYFLFRVFFDLGYFLI